MRWRTRSVILSSVLLLSSPLALPAVAGDWDICAKESGDAALAACNRTITSGDYDGGVLALAYSNRGVEWQAKGDLAKALADFDAAIKNDPLQAAAYNNRALAR